MNRKLLLASVATAAALIVGATVLWSGLGQQTAPVETTSTPASSAGPHPSATESVDPDKPLTSPATADPTASVDAKPLAPASVKQPRDLGNGVTVVVTGVTRTEAAARQPGETAGPAAAIRVEIRNRTRSPINLDAIAVNAEDAKGNPLVPNFTSSEPLGGTLAAGKSRQGTYVFRVARNIQDVTIHVHHDSTPSYVVVRT